jgi:hypothetical protein
MCKHYVILHMGLQHLQVLLSVGDSGIPPLDNRECVHVCNKSTLFVDYYMQFWSSVQK